MIRSGEIQKKANNLGVRDQQIEKDYILSWILQGISQHEELSSAMAFKGGTVLKKVYFEDYRFSEDLDFTLLDEAVDSGTILDWFTEVFGFVKQAANIPLTIIDDNEHADGGINFYISYTGPLGGTGAIFLGLSGYALTTRKDFSFMGGFIIVGILIAFLAGIGAMVFAIPAMSLAVSAMFILLMSGMILYQTSEIIHGGETNYILATISLYVSIYNLFLSLLQILGIFGGND